RPQLRGGLRRHPVVLGGLLPPPLVPRQRPVRVLRGGHRGPASQGGARGPRTHVQRGGRRGSPFPPAPVNAHPRRGTGPLGRGPPGGVSWSPPKTAGNTESRRWVGPRHCFRRGTQKSAQSLGKAPGARWLTPSAATGGSAPTGRPTAGDL